MPQKMSQPPQKRMVPSSVWCTSELTTTSGREGSKVWTNKSFFFSENFCNHPVGIQNGRIKNSAMTASSQWDVNHAAWLARLHRARRGRLMGAWSSRHNNHNQWLQIDMGRHMKCSGINTQGRQDADQWVTAYQILYGSDGTRFSYVREWWDNIKVSGQRLKLNSSVMIFWVILATYNWR